MRNGINLYSYVPNGMQPKNRTNSKKNNSICYITGYQKNKDSFINSKNNANISNNNIELNTTNYNIV